MRIDIIKEISPNGVINRIVLPQQITFLNKAALVAELNAIPHGLSYHRRTLFKLHRQKNCRIY